MRQTVHEIYEKMIKRRKQSKIEKFNQFVAQKKERINLLNKPFELITPKDACKVMQCDPSVHWFETLCHEMQLDRFKVFYYEQYSKCEQILHEQIEIKRSIVLLNKTLFKKGIIAKPSIIVGCAIYLHYRNLNHYRKSSPKISQDFLGKLCHSNSCSLYHLLRQLNLHEVGI